MKFSDCICIFIIVSILAIQSKAENILDITDLGVSAESIALGGINSNLKTAQAVFVNPAQLDHQVKWSIDTFYTTTIQDVSVQNLSVSQSYKNFVIGLGYAALGIKGIQQTTINNNNSAVNNIILSSAAPYSYYNSKYYVAGSMALLQNISLGASIKILHSEIYNIVGQGINSDFGVYFIKSGYQLGVGVHNIFPGLNMRYSDGRSGEDLPFKLFINSSKKSNYKNIESSIHFQLTQYEKYPLFYAAGIAIKHQHFPYIEGLFGLRTMLHLDETVMRKSVGLNLKVKGIKLSYAYEQTGVIYYDKMHYISLSLFNQRKTRYKQSQLGISKKIKSTEAAINGYKKKIKKIDAYQQTISALFSRTKSKLIQLKLISEGQKSIRDSQLKADRKKLKMLLKVEKKELNRLLRRQIKGQRQITKLKKLLQRSQNSIRTYEKKYQLKNEEQKQLLANKKQYESNRSVLSVKNKIEIRKKINDSKVKREKIVIAIKKEKNNINNYQAQLKEKQDIIFNEKELVKTQQEKVDYLYYDLYPKRVISQSLKELQKELLKTNKVLNMRTRQLQAQQKKLNYLFEKQKNDKSLK